MLPSLLRISLMGLTLVLGARSASAGDVVNLYTTTMGAYSDPDDKANPGVFFELVQELGRRSGITLRTQDVPWSRALKMTAQDNAPTLVLPLIRTPQREKDFSWPIKALNDRLVFFGLAGGKKVQKIDDLFSYRIGVIRGSPFERQLRTLKFANIDIANDAIDNAKKLKHKRIDYWYVAYNTGSYTFETLGFGRSDFEVAHTVSRSGVYIGANRSFPEPLAKRLQAAFAEVIADGWYQKLLDKYHVEDAGDGPGDTSKN